MKRVNLFLLSFIILFPSCFPAITLSELEDELNHKVEKQHLPGFAVSIFDKDQVYFSKGYGYADFDLKTPYRTDTKQILASVSKTIIGIALVKCQEMDLLNINKPINDYLNTPIINPYQPDSEIKVIHLATHTAGFKYSEQFTDYYNYTAADSSLQFYVNNFFTKDGAWYKADNFHNNKAGEVWDYSNAGAIVAAHIIEQVSGMEYEAFLNKHIFQPLSLSIKRYRVNDTRAKHYIIDSTIVFKPIKRKEMGIYPAGDLLCNINDLTRLYQMIMNGGTLNGERILTKKSTKILIGKHQEKNVKLIDSAHHNMGIFWWHDTKILGMPIKLIGHNGGDTGIATFAWFSPDTELGYILLSNTSFDDASFGSFVRIWQGMYKYGKTLK